MPRARLFLVLFAALALAAEVRAQDARPNVLMIAVDDLNTAVGFLSEEPGNPLQTLYPDPEARARVRAVLTPNLDRLAGSGVPFAQAYTAATICAPSRAALMTGVRPHVSRYYGGGPFRENDVLGAVATLPEYLRAHGYYAAGVGKVYHNARADLAPDGSVAIDWPDAARSWDVWVNRPTSPAVPTVWSPWSPGEDRFRFGTNGEPMSAQTDYRNAALIAQALRTGEGSLLDAVLGVTRTVSLPDDRPFFLAAGLYRPHLPWAVPQELLDLFDPDDLALTDSLREAHFRDTDDLSPGGRSKVHREGDALVDGRAKLLYEHGERVAGETGGGAVTAWTEAVRHYLAGVAHADRVVGSLLDALAEGPYARNTIVVLWGDHGWHLGEKSWFGKTTLWEESASTVLLIRPPGAVAAPGALRRQPVSLVDVFPTLVALTGVPTLAGLGGADLAPLLADPDAAPVSTALTQIGLRDHTLRTERFRYIRFGRDAEDAELYDSVLDPEERVNVIADPAYAGARTQMEARLNDALAEQPIPTSAPPLPEPPPVPEALGLSLAPNPARGHTSLTLRLAGRAHARVTLHDALGRRVAVLFSERREAGTIALEIPTGALAPGTYVVRARSGGAVVSRPFVVVR